jgi:hypothetical protein
MFEPIKKLQHLEILDIRRMDGDIVSFYSFISSVNFKILCSGLLSIVYEINTLTKLDFSSLNLDDGKFLFILDLLDDRCSEITEINFMFTRITPLTLILALDRMKNLKKLSININFPYKEFMSMEKHSELNSLHIHNVSLNKEEIKNLDRVFPRLRKLNVWPYPERYRKILQNCEVY